MKALFEIGQKVVCVDSKPRTKFRQAPLVEGKTYRILENKGCRCGEVFVDVGIIDHDGGRVVCKCGCMIDSDTWYVYQTRFVPLDFDRQADEEIKSALNESLKVKI